MKSSGYADQALLVAKSSGRDRDHRLRALV